MKPHRLRLLSASLALATAPFMGAALSTSAYASGAITVSATSSESVYGLAARLPKDNEGFLSFYRLRDLWDGFKGSNFVKKILANESLVRAMDLDDLMRDWERDPEFKKFGTMAAKMLGSEVMIATPAGFTDSFAGFLKQVPMLQAAFLGARISRPGDRTGLPPQMLPLVESLSDLNVPPVIIAMKAGAVREDLDALIKMGISQMPPEASARVDITTFPADGYTFSSLGVKASKVIPAREQEKLTKELTQATGSEEKGSALAKKLLSKTVEISWGWVDDYFVVSIGPDHSHLKFVSAADSVLTHADLAQRATQFAEKKPFAFNYTSQKSLKKMNETGVIDMLIALAGAAQNAGVPVKLDKVIAELKALDAKGDAIWPNDPDASVGAMWWDGGLHIESYGGNKPRSYDNSKPLTLPSLASDKTLLLMAGRANGPFRDKVFGWLEDLAASVWSIYQKEVKTLMPDDVRQGAAMGEMVALPMVKELWKSLQSFRAAMGEESALFLNLDGTIPEIPQANIPPDIASKGKIPRLAWMNELKDRKKLTESWSGLKTIISSVAAIAASQSGMNIPTEPTEKTEGTLETYGYKLPIDTGDLWPHTAVTPTHWFFSTSPSFTKELAGKTPSPTGPACGSHINVNFNALWNFASDWMKLLPMSPRDEEESGFVLSLLRSLRGIEVVLGEESGQAHDKVHFAIKDAE